MRRIGLALLWIATLISVAPVIDIVAAGAVATWFDCPLDEGSVHRCLVAGLDIGDSLYTAEVLGWLMFLTWPGMLVCLGLWIWLLIRRVRRAGAGRSHA